MAWYSLYKWFAPWRKKKYINWVHWYGEYICKTSEQREQERVKREERGREALAKLGMMNATIFGILDRVSNGKANEYIEDYKTMNRLLSPGSKYW